MSTDEQQASDQAGDPRENVEPETDEHHNVLEEREPGPPTDKPEITDEHREKAKEMRKDYTEDRPTIKMPGTDGAVAGTAVNEWVDDDGNPKFSDTQDSPNDG
jgi:hypothetical protein